MAAKFTHEEDDWMAEAPILAGLPKKQEAEVPDGYFEGLPDAVAARIKALEQEVEPKSDAAKILKPQWNPLWTVAASIVLLAVLSFLVWRGIFANQQAAGLPDMDLMAEVGEELEGLDEGAVAAALSATSVSDEELFAALGNEAEGLYLAESQGWQTGVNAHELDESDLDAINWDEVNIDLSNIY